MMDPKQRRRHNHNVEFQNKVFYFAEVKVPEDNASEYEFYVYPANYRVAVVDSKYEVYEKASHQRDFVRVASSDSYREAERQAQANRYYPA